MAYLKHDRNLKKVANQFLTHPAAPPPEEMNERSLYSALSRFVKTVQKLVKIISTC